MAEFRMPSLGADMDSGTVAQWLVKPGDRVGRGDIVAVVSTDKADIEVEVFESGIVGEILVPAGRRVPVGTPLATIRSEEAPAPPPTGVPATAAPIVVPAPRQAAPPPVETVPPKPRRPASVSPVIRHLAKELGVEVASVAGTGPGGRITREDVRHAATPRERPPRLRASPLARRLARELGVDLGSVRGTGSGGAITQADVERAAQRVAPVSAEGPRPAEAPPSIPPAEERQAAMRRAIANLMARSKRGIPHYYLTRETDLSRAMAWLAAENERWPVARRLLPAALLLRAVALACREVPEMNGFWVEDGFRPGDGVHLGVAISLREGGLLAPAIRDADRKNLDELMQGLRDLVSRARAGRLRRDEMADPTITVTNLGDQGVDAVHGVIYPPQVALVGFGAIADRPRAVDGAVGVRPVVIATLAADHRASDGRVGGRFLLVIDRLLQKPEEL